MRLLLFLSVSVLIHFLFVVPWITGNRTISPLGKGGRVGVEIISAASPPAPSGTPRRVEDLSDAARGSKWAPSEAGVKGSPRPEALSFKGARSSADSEWESREGAGAEPGSSPEGHDPLLAEIRARIELAKHYPLLAQKLGLEGRSLVRFQINPEGRPEGILLQSSSGSRLLDHEAVDTIRRAAPYPLHQDPLEIWIHFELGD